VDTSVTVEWTENQAVMYCEQSNAAEL